MIPPARLGLITVGGEGQLYFGALTGTAIVIGFPTAPMLLLLPAMMVAGAAGGALWAALPACCVRAAALIDAVDDGDAWRDAQGRQSLSCEQAPACLLCESLYMLACF